MADLRDLSRQLEAFRKQIPFATARAMTSVVRQIRDAQQTAIKRRLENPTPFTVNSVRAAGATKNNLVARVFVMDTAAAYLDPFEFGGTHHLSGNALLNPKNIRLNKYGNLPRTKLDQLKAKPNVFIGKVNGVSGVWQRKKPPKSKGKRRRKRASSTSRQQPKRGGSVKLLIRFGDALPVQPVLGYMDRANTMAKALLPQEIQKALAEAMRTAK
ncbi:hypothetical protein UJ18_004759 [Salmonella enterica subsp. enterica serovar Pomona]|nr:hypothetical protein [Salmonella enterica subsp. enterica serovar Pomona]